MELSNNESVLGVRARSDAPTVFGDKRDGSDLDPLQVSSARTLGAVVES